jgi:adenylate cyclase
MGREIERKFLLRSEDWRGEVERSERIAQGYLARDEHRAVRVRLQGEHAHINIKYSIDGIHRLEYEYPIPTADAREILERVASRPLIDKTRHLVRRGGHLWEIDEFHAENAGLVVAEIELGSAEEYFDRPDWLGEEVSEDARYYNSNLSRHPYTQW